MNYGITRRALVRKRYVERTTDHDMVSDQLRP